MMGELISTGLHVVFLSKVSCARTHFVMLIQDPKQLVQNSLMC